MNLEDLTARVVDYADRHAAAEAPLETAVDGLSIVRQRAPTGFSHTIYKPAFCLVLQGAKRLLAGDRILTFGRMQSLIVSVHVPVVAHVLSASRAEPYVALAVALDMEIVADVSRAAPDLPDLPDADPGVATAEADSAILDAMGRLFGLLDTPAAVTVLRPLILHEIHYWLLAGRHGRMLRTLAQPDSRSERIARTIEVIRRDFARTLRVDDLARVAGMSPSTFHEHFRAVTATTPLQFQKALKLMEARRLMLSERRSVASAAFEVGYESPTQFSREYARKFGAPPRRDVGDARASA